MLRDILYLIVGLIAGGIIGFLLARKYMKKYLKDNPPINEQMIKTMMSSMGRTPTQKQVNQMINSGLLSNNAVQYAKAFLESMSKSIGVQTRNVNSTFKNGYGQWYIIWPNGLISVGSY